MASFSKHFSVTSFSSIINDKFIVLWIDLTHTACDASSNCLVSLTFSIFSSLSVRDFCSESPMFLSRISRRSSSNHTNHQSPLSSRHWQSPWQWRYKAMLMKCWLLLIILSWLHAVVYVMSPMSFCDVMCCLPVMINSSIHSGVFRRASH